MENHLRDKLPEKAMFLEVQGALEEFEDVRCLREAKEAEKDAPTIGMAGLKEKIRGRAKQSSGCGKGHR